MLLGKINKLELKARIASAVLILILVALAIWLNNLLLAPFVFILAIAAFFELSDMANLQSHFRRLFIGGALLLVLGGMLSFWLIGSNGFVTAIGVLFAIAAGLTAILVTAYLYLQTSKLAATMWLATTYFALGLVHLFGIMELSFNVSWLVLLFAGVFTSDTSAHLIGNLFGKHKLAARISPNKTWEGVVSSLIATPLVVLLLVYLLPLDLSWYISILIGLAQAIISTSGDLIESLLKRFAGVKDASNLIPGHGGVLDRLDSLAPSAILIFWIGFVLNV